MTTDEVRALPWFARLILVEPERVHRGLERVRAAALVEPCPNLWQIFLGVVRMWQRILFRSETIGTCVEHPVRPTLRARLLRHRPMRFPFLVWEQAIAPLDASGLASSPERVLKHLLAAHHDGNQFAYDLQMLRCYPGWLERVRDAAAEVVAHDTARFRWLRDLTVYERYHENLLAAVERAIEGRFDVSDEEARDPDITFFAYLEWCARQPATPEATWEALRRGELSLDIQPGRRAMV
ncbi:Hypothetical protein A7982_03769 [Minicystis rosea]|nr:Hypothetical protein A7982_03769 [Minicystis rosea]